MESKRYLQRKEAMKWEKTEHPLGVMYKLLSIALSFSSTCSILAGKKMLKLRKSNSQKSLRVLEHLQSHATEDREGTDFKKMV